MSTQPELLAVAAEHLYPNYRQPALVMARGKGSELWDLAGKRYLDFFAGIAVNTLGHSEPRLSAALATQAQELLHVSNYYYTATNLHLVAALTRLTGYPRVFFCNSGTEAVEALLKLARRHFTASGQPERYRVLSFDNSFHGRTLGALSLTGQPKYREGFGPMSGVTHVPYGDLAAVRAAVGPDLAGIIVEPIQGEGGVLEAPPGFLAGLRAIADECGALLLADEVQTGIGRTGTMLAFEQAGVKADAVALAKGLGGGVPIGAMLCTEALAGALPPGTHGSTFGGNPLASAAALTVLTVIEQDSLLAAVTRKGAFLAQRLATLAAAHPGKIATTRGLGLLQAVVLTEAMDPGAVLAKARDAGLLLTLAGSHALRISPALTITEAELDEGIAILDQVLKG